MKIYIWFIAVLLAFGAGIYLSSGNWLGWSKGESVIEASAILDGIEKMAKLVTVAGYYSEVYDYKDYYGYDWPMFRKKALIRVKAKVLAGIDLEKVDISVDSRSQTVTMSKVPEPEILSIDHDLDYYDISEGTFNSFGTEDLNELNDRAKNYIEQAAKTSDLLRQAETRSEEVLATIRLLVEGAGWDLVLNDKPNTPAH